MVGPSGGGKTTLCNLIPRFYEVTSGRILIDGQDIKKITLQSLRNQIGTVQQEVYLFSGTIYENVGYGKPGATQEEIIRAAKLAGAHEFIADLPDGYNTYVGERGVKLSGGQKQRVAVASAIASERPLIVFDEPTSGLDLFHMRQVAEVVNRVAEHGRTVVVVTHDPEFILRCCNFVIHMEHGEIQESYSLCKPEGREHLPEFFLNDME